MEFGFAAFKSGVSLRHPDGDSQKMTDRLGAEDGDRN